MSLNLMGKMVVFLLVVTANATATVLVSGGGGEDTSFVFNGFRSANLTMDGNSSSFSTTFVFAIRPLFPTTLSGHGMVLVISPAKAFPGALPGQYLGLFDDTNNGNLTNHVFAVELDTIQSTEFEDINVGININNLKSANSTPAGYYVEGSQFQNMSLISGFPMQVWVDYD